MTGKLLEIAVHGDNSFVLLFNGRSGSQIRLNQLDYSPVGTPRIVTDVSEALKQAPAGANAYSIGEPYVRTDLHNHSLQAIQFYRVPDNLVK
ncbi:MAG: hypothetical protein AABY16_00205 [Nanoarchaeota archaeon]